MKTVSEINCHFLNRGDFCPGAMENQECSLAVDSKGKKIYRYDLLKLANGECYIPYYDSNKAMWKIKRLEYFLQTNPNTEENTEFPLWSILNPRDKPVNLGSIKNMNEDRLKELCKKTKK